MKFQKTLLSLIETFRWARKNRKPGPLRRLRGTYSKWLRFWREYWNYREKLRNSQPEEKLTLYPCLNDWTALTDIEPIYYYQDWWAFKQIAQHNPRLHVDIGSHHKFVALLSCVVRLTFVDIRPPSLPLDGLKFVKGSLLQLPFDDASIESVSSLCVIEHIGLGRYGDPLNIKGTEQSLAELKRVLRRGGKLYVSVPIGVVNETQFNAARIFEESFFLSMCDPLRLIDKVYIYRHRLIADHPHDECVGCYLLEQR